MDCLKCGFNNPEHASFCAGCGSVMAVVACDQCGSENPAGSRFCNACGHSLAKVPPKEVVKTSRAERRILTVLFCDLVDSTVLADRLDPELTRLIIRDFQKLGKDTIEENGGRIATYLGDGIVALFARHETNAERAINTALQISRRIDRAGGSFSQSQQKIQVRSGIATGLAVVGDDMLEDSSIRLESAVGLPLNLAARIQSLAEPGGTVIGNTTHQMTHGLFDFEDLGQHSLKGIQDAQRVWKVVAEKSISSRFVAHAAELTPMVDRTETRQKMADLWEKCKHNEAQTILISGEAGVGKSRIIQEFIQKISSEDEYHHLEYQCSPYHSNTALYPVVSRIKASAGIEHLDSPQQQLVKLETLVRQSSENFTDDMPIFVHLLSLSTGNKWPLPKQDPDELKERVFSTLIRTMFFLSKAKPLLVTIEDVHWIDPTMLELISRMVKLTDGYPILFIISSRPGFSPEFIAEPQVTAIKVEGLPRKYAMQLLDQVRGGSTLLDSVLDEIIRRTEGIPLYIEELSKSLLESMLSDATTPSSLIAKKDLPASLQDSLLARLDRLPDESRSIALLASVVGRDFSYDLLEKIADYENRNLYQTLTPLLEAQLVLQRRPPPGAEFSFKHALLRDVAYETLLKSDLLDIHKSIARVIEKHYPDSAKTNPELVARHFMEAKEYDKAVGYWLKAGRRASRQFALKEGREHLNSGLQCLEMLPGDEQHKTIRLEMLIALGPILMALEGSGATITRRNYEDAVKLCEQLPESTMQFIAFWGQWNVSMDYNRDQGLIWADKLQQLAEKLDKPDLKLQAHHCQWTTRFHHANHLDAKAHLTSGLALYEHKQHHHHAGLYGGHDPKVCGLCFLSFVLWFLGNYNQAEAELQCSLDFSEELNHTGSLLHAIELSLLLSQYQNNADRTRDLTAQLSQICDRIGLPEYAGKLLCCRGIVEMNEGNLEHAIELMKEGLVELNSVGTTEDIPVYTEYLAKALGRAGRPGEGLEYLDELIEILQPQRLRYWHAELFRRKGMLLLDKAELDQALASLLESQSIANKQNALSLAIRSAISLYEFEQKTAMYPQALNNLEAVYRRFEAGQSSPELSAASAILRE